jgi:hypothetical protein
VVDLLRLLMPKANFVARFDIAAYYTSMRHDVIEAQVAATDLDAHQRGLIADYLALPDSQGAGVGDAFRRTLFVGCLTGPGLRPMSSGVPGGRLTLPPPSALHHEFDCLIHVYRLERD